MTAGVSPEATGGIGTSFERRAAAAYLAAMLAHGGGPGISGVVTAVGAQTDGPLDDIVVHTVLAGGRAARTDLQLKHRLMLSAVPSAPDFAGIVEAAWRVIRAPSFKVGVDRAGGAAERVSPDGYYACLTIGEMAQLAGNGEAFVRALATPGRLSADASRIRDMVAAILVPVLGRDAQADELLLFWRHFILLRIEVTQQGHEGRLRAIDQLRPLTAGLPGLGPEQLFDMLEALAGRINTRGATLDEATVLRLLQERSAIALVPTDPQIEAVAERARSAAREDIELWVSHLDVRAVAPIFEPVDIVGGPSGTEREPAFGLDGFETHLRLRRSVTILGPPGAGKSVGLVQLAAALLETSDLVPIVRRLPALASRGGAMLDAIAANGPFRSTGFAGLETLARAGRLVLLLDGWNELGADGRDHFWGALDELRRLHPDLLLVLTSRSGTVGALPREMRVALQPFERDRQLEAATLRHGDDGAQLLIRARARRGLRPLLRIPLFLGAILEQAAQGRLPSDREEVIAALVEVARGTPQVREAVRLALAGQQFALLGTIAWELMRSGTTFIGESELVAILADALDTLRGEKRLFAAVSPTEAVDLLLGDSLLMAVGEPGRRDFAFTHQLLQEWFASKRLDAMIARPHEGPPDATLLHLVDGPFWSTALLFSVERLAREGGGSKLGGLVLATLGIEPFLAAQILVLMPSGEADKLDPELARFAGRWSEDQPDRALAFMLASGREQFGTRIWDALHDERDTVNWLHLDQRRFPLTALVPDWQARFPRLDDQTRRTLLIDVIDQGEPAGLDRAIEAAARDVEPDVVSGVIDFLDFHEERPHLNRLLGELSDAMGAQVSRGRMPEGIDGGNLARWGRWRRARFDRAEGVEWIRLALEFDAATPEAIVEATLALETDHRTAQDLHERVAERHGPAFVRALAERLRRGDALPYGTGRYLDLIEISDPEVLLTITTTERQLFNVSDAARMLNETAVGAIIDELLGACGSPRYRHEQRIGRIFDALGHVRFDRLLSAIERRDAVGTDTVAGSDVVSDADRTAVFASLVADWKSGVDDPSLPLQADARVELEARVRLWAGIALADPQGARYRLAEVARVIGRIGSDGLLSELLALWDADRARRRVQDEAFVASGYRLRGSEAQMGYDVSYREALIRIGGNLVVAATVERFADPDQEADAAIVLGRLLGVDRRPRDAFGPGHDELVARRAGLAARRDHCPAPVAGMILDRIDQLVAVGDADALDRAFRLSGPALLMDYGDRGSSFEALLAAGARSRDLRDFCTAWGERGELLPAGVVRDGVVGAIAEYDAKDWHPNNDEWPITAWLRLVAFSDDPLAALPDLASLPGRVTRANGLHGLTFALGFSTAPTAVRALGALQKADPDTLFETTWAQALAQVGSADAAEVLLDAVETGPEDPELWRDTYWLGNALAKLLAREPARSRGFAMLVGTEHPVRLAVLTAAIVETLGETVAIALLELVDRPARLPIGRALVGRLKNAAMTRVPVPGMENAYELEAAPLTELRMRAFALMRADIPGSIWARRCLDAIDGLRDRYGKPLAEPNHPDLDSGVPWPDAARSAWRVAGVEGLAPAVEPAVQPGGRK